MTRVHHPVFARVYALLSRLEEPTVAPYRDRLLEGLAGTVVEVGAGNGLNFSHYPATVQQVVAVEPEAHLRRLAERAAASASMPVVVMEGTADALPLDDGAADAAVASLVLCSVPDQFGALAEIRRVLVPGGTLVFFEHVAADSPGFRRYQRVADLVWPRVGGGCHTTRDTLAAIRHAGFRVEHVERFRLPDAPVAPPTAPMVLGRATVVTGR